MARNIDRSADLNLDPCIVLVIASKEYGNIRFTLVLGELRLSTTVVDLPLELPKSLLFQ